MAPIPKDVCSPGLATYKAWKASIFSLVTNPVCGACLFAATPTFTVSVSMFVGMLTFCVICDESREWKAEIGRVLEFAPGLLLPAQCPLAYLFFT